MHRLQWTNEVTWYYTGYGEAEVICDSINETQNFRITYIENNPKAMYLDRIIEWNEVGQTFSFMETEQVSFTQVEFITPATNTRINVTLQNTGTADMVITQAKVNGYGVDEVDDFTDVTVDAGDSAEIQIDLPSDTWTAGKAYSIELLSLKGNKFAYTATA